MKQLHLILHKEKRLRAAVFFSLTIGTIGTFHFLSDGPFLLGPQPFVIICIKASEWTLPSVVTDSNTLTFIFLIGFILVLYWFSSSRGIHQSSTNLRTFVQFHEKGRTAHCKRFSFDGKKLQPQQCKKMYLQRLSCKAFSAPNVKHWPFGKFLLLLFQECSSSFYHCTPKKTWEEEDQDTIWKGGHQFLEKPKSLKMKERIPRRRRERKREEEEHKTRRRLCSRGEPKKWVIARHSVVQLSCIRT